MDKIMLETDSPFMTPVPLRGKRNEPSNLKYIASKIAEIKSLTLDEVIQMTTATAKNLFRLSLFLLFIFTTSLYSQTQANTAIVDTLEEDLKDQYHKFIGFGPAIGSNTVVSTYTHSEAKSGRDVSYPGIFSYGGTVIWGALDFLMISASYQYSVNNKVHEDFESVDPFTYNIVSVTSMWTPNPYSRINFFGAIGYSDVFGIKYNKDYNVSAINAGLGFNINIPTSFGLFNIMASWMLDFELSDVQEVDPKFLDYLDPIKMPDISEEKRDGIRNGTSSSFYSIPRISLIFYPKF
jgi:hypothetical protein